MRFDLCRNFPLQTLNVTKFGYINMLITDFIIIINSDYGGDLMFRIDNELRGANIPRTIRFTEKLFEQLNKFAADNDVSFNYLVLQCCKYALDNAENTDGKN